jgi:hypothetical protein
MGRMRENVVAVGSSASFNGDGRLDVLARDYFTGELFVYPYSGCFNGLDTFGERVRIGREFDSDYYVWIGAGDLTGNGKADVYTTTVDGLCFLFANENGLAGLDTLAEPVQIGSKLAEVNYDSIGLADLDGDGRIDCFGRQQGTGQIDSILNLGINGMDTWAEPVPLAEVRTNDWPVAMADITGNGELDLVVRRVNGDLAVFEFASGDRTGDGRWYTVAHGWGSMKNISVADVNGDGRPDLIGVREDDGTVLAFTHSAVFDPENPLRTFQAPVVVANGWTEFDFIS